MTAFDASVNVTHIEVGVNQDNNRLMVSVVIGQALPFAEPGTDKPLMAPLGKISFPLDKASALAMAKQFQEEGEKLKADTHLEIAGPESLEHAAAASKLMDGVRRGPS